MSKSMDLNVIPLGSGDKGKAPSCGGGWEDPANFKKNNDLVKARKSPMYGVLCGKHNNLIVIDYDTHKLEETSINPQNFEGCSWIRGVYRPDPVWWVSCVSHLRGQVRFLEGCLWYRRVHRHQDY